MTIDDAVKVLDAATKLVSVLVWPSILVFVLIRFGSALRGLITSMGEFSVKGPGFEASAKMKAEAAAAIAAATVSHAEADAAPDATAREARAAAQVVARVVTPGLIRRAGTAMVLWVDNRPSNNVHERQALESLGVTFVLATSTEEALEKLNRQTFDAVISDMGRPPDSQAGYTLLGKLRAGGNRIPFIIYASSRTEEDRAEARRRGAVGCTNRPDELVEMLLSSLS